MLYKFLGLFLVLVMACVMSFPVCAEDDDDKLPEQIDVKALEKMVSVYKGADGKDWVFINQTLLQKSKVKTLTVWPQSPEKYIALTLSAMQKLAIMHALHMAMPKFEEGKEFKKSFKAWTKTLPKFVVRTKFYKTEKKDKKGEVVKDKKGNIKYDYTHILCAPAEWIKAGFAQKTEESEADAKEHVPANELFAKFVSGVKDEPKLVEAGTITVRSDTWMPVNGDPNSKSPGYAVDVLEAVLGTKGYKVNYEVMGWEESVVGVRKGDYDVVIGASKAEEGDFIFPEEEIGLSQIAFIVRKGYEWQYTGVDALKEVKIGVVEGYKYGKEIDEYIEANKEDAEKVQIIAGEDPIAENLKKLEDGKVDVVLEAIIPLEWKLQELGLTEKLVVAGRVTEIEKIYIAFSPAKETSKKYAELLNAGIVELRKSGELAKILEKYHMKDWK